MTEHNSPFDMDPRYPPRYQVLMQTDSDLPPDLLWQVLSKTLLLDQKPAQALALSILRHELVPHGSYSREIAEAKALALNQAMVAHGRMLQTRIMPCNGPNSQVLPHIS